VKCERVAQHDKRDASLFRIQQDMVGRVAWKVIPGVVYSIQSRASCAGSGPVHSNVSVAPWIDKDDPVNNSVIEVFVGPGEERLEAETQFLCATGILSDAEVDPCICTMSHTDDGSQNSVVASLAAFAPGHLSNVFRRALHAERCPSPWLPDAVLLAVAVLLMLSVVIVCEALTSAWAAHRSVGRPVVGSNVVKFTQPWKILPGTGGAALGTIALISNMQRMGLSILVELGTSWAEKLAWISFALCLFFGSVTAWRLHQVLARTQLVHALLANHVSLEPVPSFVVFDAMLVSTFVMFFMVVVLDMFLELNASQAASVWCMGTLVSLLAGPLFGIAKTYLMANEKDRMTAEIPTHRAALAELLAENSEASEKKVTLTLLTWSQLVSGCRAGGDVHDVAASDETDSPSATSDETDSPSAESFSMWRDLMWQRRAVHSLTGSLAGYAVLPSFTASMLLIFTLSLSHSAGYACTTGQLIDLQLNIPTDMAFRQWQHRYSVGIERNLTEAALFASADANMAHNISFEPAFEVSGQNGGEDVEATVGGRRDTSAKVHVNFSMLPLENTVSVQGPRPSQPPKQFELQLLPRQVRVLLITIADSSGRFKRQVPWADLPHSRVSIPRNLAVSVSLSFINFTMGIPIGWSEAAPDGALVWTVLRRMPEPTVAGCEEQCSQHPHCLASYPGRGGCFMARFKYNLHDAVQLERAQARLQKQVFDRGSWYADLCGCALSKSGAGQCCTPILAAPTAVRFSDIMPDWQAGSHLGRLQFTSTLFIGANWLRSDPDNLQIWRGHPFADDAVVKLEGVAVNGSSLSLRASVDIPISTGSISITLQRYDPGAIQDWSMLTLELTPLCDSSFEVRWPKTSTHRNSTAVMLISPWSGTPSAHSPLNFEIALKSQLQAAEGSLWGSSSTFPVEIKFEGGVDSPIVWFVQQRGCSLLTSSDTGRPLFDYVLTSVDAVCEFQALGCNAADSSEMVHIVVNGLADMDRGSDGVRVMVCAWHYQQPGHGDNTDITADVAELFQNYDLVSHRSCEGKSAWECAREKDAIPTGLVTLMSTVAEYKSDQRQAAERLLHDICVATLTTVPNCIMRVEWLDAALKYGSPDVFHEVLRCLRELDPNLPDTCWVQMESLIARIWQTAEERRWPRATTERLLLSVGNETEKMREFLLKTVVLQGHVARTAASYPPFWQLFHGLHTLELSVPKDGVLRLLGQNLGLLEGVHDLAIKCVADCEPKDGILPEGMLAFLLRLPNLSRLSMRMLNITEASLRADDVGVARQTSKPWSLYIESCSLAVSTLATLSSNARMSSLTKLTITGGIAKQGFLTFEHVAVFSRFLCNFQHLDELKLKHHSIDSNGFNALAMAMYTCKSSLSLLDLGRNHIGRKEALDIPAGAFASTALRRLRLNGNMMSDKAMVILAQGVMNSSLVDLELGYNAISDEGASALARSVPSMPNLTKVVLLGNTIGDRSALALAAALFKEKRVQWFDIGSNELTKDVQRRIEREGRALGTTTFAQGRR